MSTQKYSTSNGVGKREIILIGQGSCPRNGCRALHGSACPVTRALFTMDIARHGPSIISKPPTPAATEPMYLDEAGSTGVSTSQMRRPTSAGRIRQPSTVATSRVHQKLQAALLSADSRVFDFAQTKSLQSSFRARGAAAAESEQADRSVSRYRSDAAMVSFADASPTSSFCYSTNFMPGVHFYTFLASKDTNSAATTSASTSSGPDSSREAAPIDAAAQPVENGEQQRPATAKKSGGLQMWIPDTIVYGETGRAVLLYTDERGFIQRSTDVTDKIVVERLVPTNTVDLQPTVVCKEPTTTSAKKESDSGLAYQGNLLRLLSPGELKTVLSNVSSTRSTKSFALQKFIRCNGSKAFIVRAVYEAGKPAYAWMINNTTPMVTPTPTVSQVLLSIGQEAGNVNSETTTVPPRSSSVLVSATPRSSSVIAASSPSRSGSLIGTSSRNLTTGAPSGDNAAPPPLQATVIIPLVNRVCTTVQLDKACTFIKLSERGCASVAELNQRLVKYIEQRLHIQLQTLVADFVKDTDGKWWLLQVKHFRVKHMKSSKPYYSLPRRLRIQYLGYRDTTLIDETTESDEENDLERQIAHLAAQHAQRQVLKLSQCKCCLAAYPKSELSFKMTLKMINEMLVRLRSRLPPEKSYTFLASALAREPPDASLAYESWSVCSYCYAIYERDQQLQNVEAKFGELLGVPDSKVALAGLEKLDDRAQVVDPTASSTVLPAQLTLCRLMLVINGIYDIPPELYDAERDPVEILVGSSVLGAGPSRLRTVSSRLYLRISALGYTECIPVNPADIIFTNEQAPRGTRPRQPSRSSLSTGNGTDDDDDDDSDGEGTRTPRRNTPYGKRNYWLPINLIRTVTFFAPRTPLNAKLKETSGLMPFLNEDNSISIQFIRATEPPLHDITLTEASKTIERGKTRRAALQPNRKKTASAKATPSVPKGNHSVLLGATKIRMAQFRSAYVTKLDFYACMALRGEMFNVKGNIGLERVRYVDTKLLTSQYRLRMYNGVYIPDASYIPCDPLTSEWMDCLRASVNPHEDIGISPEKEEKSADTARSRVPSLRLPERSREAMRRATSTTSLGACGEEMDEELEDMIDRVSGDRPAGSSSKATRTNPQSPSGASRQQPQVTRTKDEPSANNPPGKQSLLPTSTTPSRVDSQMSMLLKKPVLSPRANSASHFSSTTDSMGAKRLLWSLTIQLNNAHNLQTRERPFCRWECYYELLGQRRSAVERSSRNPDSPTHSTSETSPLEIAFSCTHRFFVSATVLMLHGHFHTNRTVALHLRNDVYSSTRSRSTGEFYCQLDLAELVTTNSFEKMLDIHATAVAPELTPREAAEVSRSPPYLSVSVQLAQLATDPDEVVTNGDFVVVGATGEGIHVLKKIV